MIPQSSVAAKHALFQAEALDKINKKSGPFDGLPLLPSELVTAGEAKAPVVMVDSRPRIEFDIAGLASIADGSIIRHLPSAPRHNAVDHDTSPHFQSNINELLEDLARPTTPPPEIETLVNRRGQHAPSSPAAAATTNPASTSLLPDPFPDSAGRSGPNPSTPPAKASSTPTNGTPPASPPAPRTAPPPPGPTGRSGVCATCAVLERQVRALTKRMRLAQQDAVGCTYCPALKGQLESVTRALAAERERNETLSNANVALVQKVTHLQSVAAQAARAGGQGRSAAAWAHLPGRYGAIAMNATQSREREVEGWAARGGDVTLEAARRHPSPLPPQDKAGGDALRKDSDVVMALIRRLGAVQDALVAIGKMAYDVAEGVVDPRGARAARDVADAIAGAAVMAATPVPLPSDDGHPVHVVHATSTSGVSPDWLASAAGAGGGGSFNLTASDGASGAVAQATAAARAKRRGSGMGSMLAPSPSPPPPRSFRAAPAAAPAVSVKEWNSCRYFGILASSVGRLVVKGGFSDSRLGASGGSLTSSHVSSGSKDGAPDVLAWLQAGWDPNANQCVAMVAFDVEHADLLRDTCAAAFEIAVELYASVVRTIAGAFGGLIVGVAGDAMVYAFLDAAAAAATAAAVQVALLEADWPSAILDHPASATQYTRTQPLPSAPAPPVGGKTRGAAAAAAAAPPPPAPPAAASSPTSGAIFRGLRIAIGIHYAEPVSVVDRNTHRVHLYGPVLGLALRACAAAAGGEILTTLATVEAIKSDGFASLGIRVMDVYSAGAAGLGVGDAASLRRLVPETLMARFGGSHAVTAGGVGAGIRRQATGAAGIPLSVGVGFSGGARAPRFARASVSLQQLGSGPLSTSWTARQASTAAALVEVRNTIAMFSTLQGLYGGAGVHASTMQNMSHSSEGAVAAPSGPPAAGGGKAAAAAAAASKQPVRLGLVTDESANVGIQFAALGGGLQLPRPVVGVSVWGGSAGRDPGTILRRRERVVLLAVAIDRVCEAWRATPRLTEAIVAVFLRHCLEESVSFGVHCVFISAGFVVFGSPDLMAAVNLAVHLDVSLMNVDWPKGASDSVHFAPVSAPPNMLIQQRAARANEPLVMDSADIAAELAATDAQADDPPPFKGVPMEAQPRGTNPPISSARSQPLFSGPRVKLVIHSISVDMLRTDHLLDVSSRPIHRLRTVMHSVVPGAILLPQELFFELTAQPTLLATRCILGTYGDVPITAVAPTPMYVLLGIGMGQSASSGPVPKKAAHDASFLATLSARAAGTPPGVAVVPEDSPKDAASKQELDTLHFVLPQALAQRFPGSILRSGKAIVDADAGAAARLQLTPSLEPLLHSCLLATEASLQAVAARLESAVEATNRYATSFDPAQYMFLPDVSPMPAASSLVSPTGGGEGDHAEAAAETQRGSTAPRGGAGGGAGRGGAGRGTAAVIAGGPRHKAAGAAGGAGGTGISRPKDRDAPVTCCVLIVAGGAALWEKSDAPSMQAIDVMVRTVRSVTAQRRAYEVCFDGATMVVLFGSDEDALSWSSGVQTALLAAPWPTAFLAQPAFAPVSCAGTLLYRGVRVSIGVARSALALAAATVSVSAEAPLLASVSRRSTGNSLVGDGGVHAPNGISVYGPALQVARDLALAAAPGEIAIASDVVDRSRASVYEARVPVLAGVDGTSPKSLYIVPAGPLTSVMSPAAAAAHAFEMDVYNSALQSYEDPSEAADVPVYGRGPLPYDRWTLQSDRLPTGGPVDGLVPVTASVASTVAMSHGVQSMGAGARRRVVVLGIQAHIGVPAPLRMRLLDGFILRALDSSPDAWFGTWASIPPPNAATSDGAHRDSEFGGSLVGGSAGGPVRAASRRGPGSNRSPLSVLSDGFDGGRPGGEHAAHRGGQTNQEGGATFTVPDCGTLEALLASLRAGGDKASTNNNNNTNSSNSVKAPAAAVDDALRVIADGLFELADGQRAKAAAMRRSELAKLVVSLPRHAAGAGDGDGHRTIASLGSLAQSGRRGLAPAAILAEHAGDYFHTAASLMAAIADVVVHGQWGKSDPSRTVPSVPLPGGTEHAPRGPDTAISGGGVAARGTRGAVGAASIPKPPRGRPEPPEADDRHATNAKHQQGAPGRGASPERHTQRGGRPSSSSPAGRGRPASPLNENVVAAVDADSIETSERQAALRAAGTACAALSAAYECALMASHDVLAGAFVCEMVDGEILSPECPVSTPPAGNTQGGMGGFGNGAGLFGARGVTGRTGQRGKLGGLSTVTFDKADRQRWANAAKRLLSRRCATDFDERIATSMAAKAFNTMVNEVEMHRDTDRVRDLVGAFRRKLAQEVRARKDADERVKMKHTEMELLQRLCQRMQRAIHLTHSHTRVFHSLFRLYNAGQEGSVKLALTEDDFIYQWMRAQVEKVCAVALSDGAAAAGGGTVAVEGDDGAVLGSGELTSAALALGPLGEPVARTRAISKRGPQAAAGGMVTKIDLRKRFKDLAPLAVDHEQEETLAKDDWRRLLVSTLAHLVNLFQGQKALLRRAMVAQTKDIIEKVEAGQLRRTATASRSVAGEGEEDVAHTSAIGKGWKTLQSRTSRLAKMAEEETRAKPTVSATSPVTEPSRPQRDPASIEGYAEDAWIAAHNVALDRFSKLRHTFTKSEGAKVATATAGLVAAAHKIGMNEVPSVATPATGASRYAQLVLRQHAPALAGAVNENQS